MNDIKKALIIIVILLTLFLISVRADTGVIVEVADDGTTIWTSDLNVWEVYDKVGEKGDECTVIFNTMGTEKVYDDAVIGIIMKGN